jgi:dsRNA-specific ribonuclease
MDAMLGAIAFDTTTERTQRFTLDAIMNANNLIF